MLVKGKLSKPLLYHFIDELEAKGFIADTEDRPSLFKKLRLIFVDHNGNELKNFATSKSYNLTKRKKDKTEQEVKIDAILAELIKEPIIPL